MVRFSKLVLIFSLFILGACASKMKNQMKDFRDAVALGDYEKAEKLLKKSVLKKDKKSELLYQLEKGTLYYNQGNFDGAVTAFQTSLDLIDKLFTTKLSSKAQTLLINDASDEFYGASYERSYAFYYLAQSYYQRFQKTGTKLDLQSARAAILAWDTYFTELKRDATAKTLYHTDLMLKVFGGEIHEVSEVRNDKQIALQLYKDALGILALEGGMFSTFNSSYVEYIKEYEEKLKSGKSVSQKNYSPTPAHDDLKDLLHYKILSLTKEIRGFDLAKVTKDLKPSESVKNKLKDGPGNVVIVLQEGFIPPKLGKPFNFGIKGAMNSVSDPSAKAMIATVGVGFITAFAMNKLGMMPTQTASPGSFLFAHDVTRLAVTEAAIEFELPMIENVPLVQRLELFILDEKGVVVKHAPLPIVSENGDIARIVLEEDVVARYVKTGTRVAVKHLLAIISAIGVYQKLKTSNDQGDFLAKSAAMATYIGASKGISAMERADTRHWTTLPQALRLTELKLPPGTYQLALGIYSGSKAPDAPSKMLGSIRVDESSKKIFTQNFTSP